MRIIIMILCMKESTKNCKTVNKKLDKNNFSL